jgi:hypothetical protein
LRVTFLEPQAVSVRARTNTATTKTFLIFMLLLV